MEMVVRTPVATELIPTDPGRLGRRSTPSRASMSCARSSAGSDAWLVGGAVRDLLLGGTRADLDLVVEGDAAEVAALLGAEPKAQSASAPHPFGVGDVRVDVARARRETYAQPGALPDVEPATARRRPRSPRLHRERDGAAALRQGRADRPARRAGRPRGGAPARASPDSFRDDPTRALRAARYAARLDLGLEPETSALLEGDRPRRRSPRTGRTQSSGVFSPRRAAPEALALLAGWGLAGIDEAAPERVQAMRELLADPDWAEVAGRAGRGVRGCAAERRDAPRRGDDDRASRPSAPRKRWLSSPGEAHPPRDCPDRRRRVARRVGARVAQGHARDRRRRTSWTAGVAQGPAVGARSRGGACGAARRRDLDARRGAPRRARRRRET